MARPEKYLTESQVVVFKALIEAQGGGMSMKSLATQLNYERGSSLSMMIRRIREKIADISIEDHDVGL